MFGWFGGQGSTGSSTTTTTTPVVTPFWTASSASTTYNYSAKGNLTSIEYTYTDAGKSATKTVKHQESEHIRAKVNANLVKPLPAGNLPDKPKDLTPTAPSYDKFINDED
jgi:hypothetical protein